MWGKVSPGARVALAWLVSRLTLMVAVLVIARLAGIGPEVHPLASGNWVADRFAYWDSYHFTRIASVGYLPPGLECCDQAFFPGYPLLIAAVAPFVGGSQIVAGIVVTLVAGTAAAVLLWQLVREDPRGGPVSARRAVLLLALAPFGFFLVAVYTEATFLAFAVGAWLLARRGHWWWAASLAACASAVRVNGLFVALGLAVMWALDRWGTSTDGDTPVARPRWSTLPALALPALPVLGYTAYLHARTGSWNAWREAEHMGWGRVLATPWTGLSHAVAQVGATDSWFLAASRVGDIAAVLLGIVVIAVLVWQRRWAETAFLVPSVGVIVCSTLWVSAGRYALTWFPVYLALATLGEGWAARWAWRAVVVACVPLLALATYAAATRQWVA